MEDILNFLQITDKIATSGQPTETQFSAIAAAGYQVVVNLALPTSTNALPNEQQLVASLGMEYIHIPVIWESPTQKDIEQFFATLTAHTSQRVFVHCAMNMRVSAFIYLYRRLCQQLDDKTIKPQMLQIWTPNPIWQAFIEEVIANYSL